MKILCKISDAVELFGRETVEKVIYLVDISGPDEMYITFTDMEMYDEANCVSFMYFEEC